MTAKFGPAGNCEDFWNSGHKSSLEIPKWIHENHLDHYEYQCGHGVRISKDAAVLLGENAQKYQISLSVHAPYYISLSSVEEEKRLHSIDYILQTLEAAKNMGAKRIVVHSGSCGKITRKEALALAKNTLSKAIRAADESGYTDIAICPETMGKINQLGTLEEVMKLCQLDERLIPTIDFGHLNARTLGSLKSKEDFTHIFDTIENMLGKERAASFHAHYSRIEYTNSGEKKHHIFEETQYGPEFDPIAQITAERHLSPTFICESAGTQTRDAAIMKKIYQEKLV